MFHVTAVRLQEACRWSLLQQSFKLCLKKGLRSSVREAERKSIPSVNLSRNKLIKAVFGDRDLCYTAM